MSLNKIENMAYKSESINGFYYCNIVSVYQPEP